MAVELVMPRLSESMEEGTIVSWLVADGAQVLQGEEIAEIETDKATLPYEAPESGVLRILVPEGTTLALGQPIGLIDDLVPLPGGQSVAPPGSGRPATAIGRVPAPRAPHEEPATASFAIQPDLHEPPHTVHASTAPPAQSPDAAWSPAWGPQPAAARDSRQTPPPPSGNFAAEDEGETTEFAAVGTDENVPEDSAPEQAAVPAPPSQADEARDARAAALADDGSGGYGPLFGDVTPDEAAADAVATAEATEASIAAMPWVDASFSPKSSPPATGSEPAGDQRRFTPDELIAPATLPPRPPELQPTATARARIPASPVARRLARELGIDLSTIEGTGPEGRVVRADIEAAQATGAARPPKQAAAARVAASEFTPPVDDERAAAPIPTVDPSETAPASEPLESAPSEAPASASSPGVQPDTSMIDEPAAEPADPAEALVEAAADVAAELITAADPEIVSPPLPPADLETPNEADAVHDEAALIDDAQSQAVDAAPESAPAAEPEAEPETAIDSSAESAPEAKPAPDSESRVLPAAQPGRGKGEPTIVELNRQQQTVARRMAESKATIPAFHTDVQIDAGPLMALRAELATTRPDLTAPSINDLLVKAVAVALRAFPSLNGAYRDGRLEQYPRVNIGIAVDAGGALLVPVVHDADQLSVSQIAARTDDVVVKARDGSLRPPDIASATFTLSNLGTHGVDRFTAVITPGQAAILTAGAIAERPIVRAGVVVAGHTLTLTLTTDHRAVYGAEAARFLGRLRQLLEHPTSLLA